jgi:hypothetical protein
MSNNVQSRIFSLLADLIPNLTSCDSREHFAPARVPGDMAVHCSVDEVKDGHLAVEIAHDQLAISGRAQSWICFDVDTERCTAKVTRMQERDHYAVAGHAQASVNVYAANWLAIFRTLGRVFQPLTAS